MYTLLYDDLIVIVPELNERETTEFLFFREGLLLNIIWIRAGFKDVQRLVS